MKYWVNFSNGAMAITNSDLNDRGFTEVTESEYDWWYKRNWEELVERGETV